MLVIKSETSKTSLKFVEAINSHNEKIISSMMTEDHKFIDSLGKSLKGKIFVTEAWRSYFKMFPDYFIRIDEVVEKENLVVLLGFAQGSLSESLAKKKKRKFKIKVALAAKLKGCLVSEWRVYADNKPVYELLEMNEIWF